MRPLLNEINWSEPLLPEARDPELEKVIRKALPNVPVYPECLRLIAPVPWVAYAMMPIFQPIRVAYTDPKLAQYVVLAACQQNSCRYCYGAVRALLKILGYDERTITDLERDVKLLEGDERAAIEFAWKLAESNPRPTTKEKERLRAAGFEDETISEISGLVSGLCFTNRVATFLAVAPQQEIEQLPATFIGKLLRPLIARKTRPRRVTATNVNVTVPYFDEVIRQLGKTVVAEWANNTVNECFSSDIIEGKTKLLMFATVARLLGCEYCEEQSCRALEARGLERTDTKRILETLNDGETDSTDSRLIEWARDTVWYEPAVIQSRTRELRDGIQDDRIVIEAIATAALANSIVRLAMLM